MTGGLVNEALYVFIAFSWHVCLKDIGQNVEVFFYQKEKRKENIFLIRLVKKIIGQLIDYQNNH